MNQLRKRLTALESSERSAPRFPAMTPALMLGYGTEEECAEREAAGRPALDRAAFEKVLDQVYSDQV